jgi:hypothetical protein
VAPHWLPRQSYAGTYDAECQQHRAPYLPRDFNPRFCQIAPTQLTAPSHLHGGEPVELRGAAPGEPLRFILPAIKVEASYRIDGNDIKRAASLDTVIIEPDAARLVMVWRAALTCDKRALKVHEVEITTLAQAPA